MNKHQHSDDLIKKKIDEHEFDFQDRAWDNMNDLLDSSARMPRRKAFLFFNRNKWMLMIILFLIIGMTAKTVFFPAPNVNVERTSLSVTPNEQVTPTNHTIELKEKEATENIKNNKQKNYPTTSSNSITKKSSDLITKPLNLDNYIDLSRDNFRLPYAQSPLKDTWQLFNFPITDAPPTEKVYLHLDRTLYKPGEAIWFSAYIQERGLEETSDVVYVDFIAPNGNIEKSLTLITKDGQATGDILIPKEAVGGGYKIKAYTNWQRNFDDAFERTIQVQKAVLPNLRMELEFARKAYGASDEVEATLDLKDLANAALSNHIFKYTASLDGTNIKTLSGKTDEKGIAKLTFKLPQSLTTNNGLVNVMIDYNGQTESIARPIPIVLNKIDLQFLPESGDLVANLESKIAFKAIDEFGQPADISGTVKDENGQVITTFTSYHQGMGAFDFIPQYGKTYYATITQPQNIKQTYVLPKAEHSGIVMQVTHKDKMTLKVKISTSNTTQPHQLTIQGYGKTYLTKTLAPQQFQTIEIPTNDLPLGIVAVTLTNKSEMPIAERLVFVNPYKQLHVDISTDKEKYLPREKVQMNVRITDEQAQPVKGQFSLSVVDDKLLSFADNKQGHILSYLLLESELKGSIEEPNFYFEPKEKHPKKDQQLALDYLMLTQGWRRFDYVSDDVESFVHRQETAKLSGILMDQYDQPLANTELKIRYTDKITKTDANGYFEFENHLVTKKEWIDIFIEGKAKRSLEIYNNSDNFKVKVFDYLYYAYDFNLGKHFDIDTSKSILATVEQQYHPEVQFREFWVYPKNGKRGDDLKLIKKEWLPMIVDSKTYRNTHRYVNLNEKGGELEPFLVSPQYAYWKKGQNGSWQLKKVINEETIYASFPSRVFEVEKKETLINKGKSDTLTISGKVFDYHTNQPISHAIIHLKNECGLDIREFVTDESGYFKFGNLQLDCDYKINASKSLFYSKSKVKKFNSKENILLNVAIRLEAMAFVDSKIINPPTDPLEILNSVNVETLNPKGVLAKEKSHLSSSREIRNVSNAPTRIIQIPAEYETVTEQVIVKPATTKWVKRKADKNALAKNPDIKEVWCLVEVPTEYKAITKTKLKKAAYQKVVDVPAEYHTITKKVLVQPAQNGQPPVYENVTEQVIATDKTAPTIAEALQGRAAGVQVTPSNGTPGASSTIQIRGISSMSGNEPLYVVDGVPQKRKILKSLNPDDIKKIEILKDQSATAIYGSRGNYGVVLITTKKGKEDKKSNKRFQEKLEEQLKTNKESYQEQIWTYQNYYAESIAALQSGKLADYEAEYIQSELIKKEYALKKSADILNIIGDLAKQEVNTDYEKINTNELINAYQYANNFKKGLYKTRKFYAPKYEAPIISNERTDFRSTIYWQPTLELNEQGEATVEFYNSDAITTFKAVVEGIGNNGAIGRGTQTYYAQMPFGMMTKLPTVIMSEDVVKIPVTLSNHTDKVIKGQLTATVPSNFVFQAQSYPNVTLQAKESKTIFLVYDIKRGATTGEISVQFKAKGHQDAISETVTLLEKGFPVKEVYAGKSLEKTFEVDIHNLKKGTLQAQFTAYPSVLNDMAESAERMMRQPTGCFEQTTSANYPNLLALSYLKATKQTNPTLENKAYNFLDKGYKRLLTFEVKDKEGNLGGFDWYGKPPANEGLTAYGLMQFVDMQKIYPVDQALIDRTASWLLERRDGKGSWKRANSWRFGNAKPDVSDAYIVWAMTEAGYGDQINLELETAYQKAVQSKDAYRLALLTNTLQKQNDVRANSLLRMLLKMQTANGDWTAERTFVTSYGRNIKIETTALVTLAMLNAVKIGEDGLADNGLSHHIEKAIQFLASAKNQYGFGSTQSTILAMKALIAYAQYTTNNSTQNGVIILSVDDKVVAELPYLNNQISAIKEDLVPYLKEGKQTVTVKFEGVDKALTYDIAVNYQTDEPRSDAECKVRLNTVLNQKQVKQGEIVRLTTTIKNTTSEDLPNTIAIVGIPSGLSLQPWQLKGLQEKEAFDYYELMDGYIVFHYRGLAADAVKTVHLDLKADLKGNYTAPASSSYLYYVNEFVDWSTPLSIEIQ